MVRASVRAITLQVYKVEDAAIRHFVTDRSSQSYFCHLACHLRELWMRLGFATARGDSSAVQEENEQQQDLLCYISDILSLDVPSLNAILADRMLSFALFPVLLGSLAETGKEDAAA